MSINLTDDERAWVVPVLHELHHDGTVTRAESWSALRAEVLDKLGDYGAKDHAESFVRPLDEAVAQGTDYKALVEELSSGYTGPVTEEPYAEESPAAPQAEPTLAESDPESAKQAAEAAEFEKLLPAADEFAQAILMDLGEQLGQLIAADRELAASLDGAMLVDWVAADVAAAIDQLTKSESAWLA